MSSRSYVSPIRSASAEETRRGVVHAAAQFLREQGIAKFSLDAVAKAAGVTRLTVYNQFGSRKGLLEAVFDDIAEAGQVARVRAVAESKDPAAGLESLVDIMCDFWGRDPAIGRLHDAVGLDEEFGQALMQRQERRRAAIAPLVKLASSKKTAVSVQREAVDMIFSLTSCAMYRMLAATQSDKAIRRLLKAACLDAIKRVS